jgi:hypothetical protein
MLRRRLLTLFVVIVVMAACSNDTDVPGPNDGSSLNFSPKATIVVDDTGIDPAVTTARVGDALTVVNRGTRDHGLTSETVDSGTLRPGESTVVFLTQTGTIELRDRTDRSHTARIEVMAGPDAQ